MASIFKRLERVLKLEAAQGYENKSVVGGIAQFGAFWVGQAEEEAVDELDSFLIEQVGTTLASYGRLHGAEARRKAIDALLDLLSRRDARLGPAAAAPPPRAADPQRRRPQERQSPTPAVQAAPEPAKTPAFDPAAAEKLAQPVTVIGGVGKRIAEQLERLGGATIGDLLTVFPRRYDDYSLLKPIHRLEVGEVVTVIGTVWETRVRRTRANQKIVQTVLTDGTGKIQATWFNQAWLADKLSAGRQVVLSGRVEQYLGRKVFNNPEWEPLAEDLLKTGRIVPVYPLTRGLGGNRMRALMKQVVDEWSALAPDPLPSAVRQRQKLVARPEAIRQKHFPDNHDALLAAERRLAFDELFMLQLGMLSQRHDWQQHPALALPAADGVLDAFLNQFPFSPTGAQSRAIDEIVTDMARTTPMNRLLQGDVGAGKTLVAAAALYVAVKNGAQAAMMAPTEILAEQHYRGLDQVLTPLGVKVALLTGRTRAADREATYAALADGSADIVIGTHALIQPNVTFRRLGLTIVDEQHRFGVDQRGALRDKGVDDNSPHLLVMSATPIPRTLALSMYGDLDLSILDEMPPGRQEIKTRWLEATQRERAYRFVRRQIEEGRQAFIIYPLVDTSEALDARSATEEYERLQTSVFHDLRVGLVHGRMSGDEKDDVMRRFNAGEIDILVATTVIEVGIDVPNANVIIIDGANRFGLAQLHQLRGRVGRGEHQSYCILIADATSADAAERLSALEDTNDGFQLAEKDLEIRGPGEFFGRRQSGLPELSQASLFDTELLERARDEATELFAADPLFEQPQHAAVRAALASFWAQSGDAS